MRNTTIRQGIVKQLFRCIILRRLITQNQLLALCCIVVSSLEGTLALNGKIYLINVFLMLTS